MLLELCGRVLSWASARSIFKDFAGLGIEPKPLSPQVSTLLIELCGTGLEYMVYDPYYGIHRYFPI